MNLRSISLFLLVLLAGCRGRTNELNVRSQEPSGSMATDSTLIFDGNTLNGWEITNFGPQGPVYVSGNAIVLGMGDGCTGVTYKNAFPEMNYKVCLEAKRVSGVDFFCGMTFPVGKDPCTLIIGGWAGSTVGLSSIDGNDASENETTRLMKFENDRWYKICLEVREGTIKAWIDDSLVVDFVRNGKRLSIRPEVELSKPFGICSWNTTAELRNIRVEPVGN